MNVNDPYIIAALPHWSGEPTTGDILWRAAIMREDDQDRAVIARIGGNEYRKRFGRTLDAIADRAANDDAVADRVAQVQRNRKASRRAMLPEAAFDWPVYVAAIRTGDRAVSPDETSSPTLDTLPGV